MYIDISPAFASVNLTVVAPKKIGQGLGARHIAQFVFDNELCLIDIHALIEAVECLLRKDLKRLHWHPLFADVQHLFCTAPPDPKRRPVFVEHEVVGNLWCRRAPHRRSLHVAAPLRCGR